MAIIDSITHYCQYQPRSHKEVRNKLYELGCTTPEVDDNILKLIETGLLNEERYARAIARGKFRIKHWGKNKIIEQLRQQQVSVYCIRLAMTEIDDEEYQQKANELAEKKWREMKTDRKSRIQQQKVYRYLLQKGYEAVVIKIAINETLK